MTIRVSVAGATGKLGRVVCRLIEDADDLELVAALNSQSPLDDMLGADGFRPDVLVDTTHPAASAEIVEFAVRHGVKVLVGTSGWSAPRIVELERVLRDVPEAGVVIVPNFSIGSALGTALATVAARFFDSIEIIEAHAESKVDSPSGTAVRTAELIGAARTERGPVDAPHNDQRARGQQVASIPIHSMRMRGVVASQRVVFGGSGETLSIQHDTVGSESYEPGILLGIRAAATQTGVIVGLDKLMDLGLTAPGGEAPAATVRET